MLDVSAYGVLQPAGGRKIAVWTVKNHITHICTKLGVHSRAEAVAWAWQHGVVKPDNE